MASSEYGTEAHVVSTTPRTMVLDGEFDGNDQLTYRPDCKVLLVESEVIEGFERDIDTAAEAADAAEDAVREAAEKLANVGDERDALREKLADAEATIARARRFAEDMRGWCSPHGVAWEYAARLDRVIDGGE
jgi:hypothetical protein